MTVSPEYSLHRHHIANRPCHDADECIALPDMESDHRKAGDQGGDHGESLSRVFKGEAVRCPQVGEGGTRGGRFWGGQPLPDLCRRA